MNIVVSIRMLVWMMFLTGVLYPIIVTLIAVTTMKEKASGSMVSGKGSELIAQKFTSEHFFWGRPSAVDYNPLPSGASNLSVTSAALKKQVNERLTKFTTTSKVPPELLFASASGLDPHISPETAYFQIDRIAHARGVDKTEIRKLVDSHIENSWFGTPCINVLLLNLALGDL